MQDQLVALARDLQSGATAEQTLQTVVDAAVEIVAPCQSAGTFLTYKDRRVETSVATDSMAVRGHELQVECGEGPCIDAVWEERVISVPDLINDRRWPTWAPRAVSELGVGSMLCLRLFTHEDRLGALNLFSSRANAFTPDDVDSGVAVAAHSAVAVAAANQIDQLHAALDSRTIIGQATGLMMGVYSIDSDAAWSLLRRPSSTENRKIVDIAAELVHHHNDDARQERRTSPR